MTIVILISVGFASLAGLLVGFRKYWEEAALIACLAVPGVSSLVFAIFLGAPTVLDTLMWAVLAYLSTGICAFLAWGLCAGANYTANKLYRKLTHRSSKDRPQAAGPLS